LHHYNIWIPAYAGITTTRHTCEGGYPHIYLCILDKTMTAQIDYYY